MHIRLCGIFLVFFFWIANDCLASDVYLLDLSSGKSVEIQYIKIACKFYGINIVESTRESEYILKEFSYLVKSNQLSAVIISSDSLPQIDYKKFDNIISKNKIPVLIFGVTHSENGKFVNIWSKGAISNCQSISGKYLTYLNNISNDNAITRELSGISLPYKNDRLNYFLLNKDRISKILINTVNDGNTYPVFVQTGFTGMDMFFMTKIEKTNIESTKNNDWKRELFTELSPIMMFIRHACKERCWGSGKKYATLIIDDPWLREPYGHIRYRNLLAEMKKERFHTTIAFIPWNYDRSEEEVVSLFRNNPEKLSIAIHGNDHDHEEFYGFRNVKEYDKSLLLSKYEFKVQQALVRMRTFQQITGIPIFPVMVFPHKIGPVEVLKQLKKYNYLATVNSNNVPTDSLDSDDPVQKLRDVSMNFESFASYKRYGIKTATKEDIAVNLFLDNPVILYGHHDYFINSIGAFNHVAKTINAINPNVEWMSLGNLVREYHLEKSNGHGEQEVMMFAGSMQLINPNNRDIKYTIFRDENYSVKIRNVMVDGKVFPYNKRNNHMEIEIVVPARASMLVQIVYENDLDMNQINIQKNNIYFNMLRRISDFRDIYLSRIVFGQIIIGNYYDFYKERHYYLIIFALSLLIMFICIYRYVSTRGRSNGKEHILGRKGD